MFLFVGRKPVTGIKDNILLGALMTMSEGIVQLRRGEGNKPKQSVGFIKTGLFKY